MMIFSYSHHRYHCNLRSTNAHPAGSCGYEAIDKVEMPSAVDMADAPRPHEKIEYSIKCLDDHGK